MFDVDVGDLVCLVDIYGLFEEGESVGVVRRVVYSEGGEVERVWVYIDGVEIDVGVMMILKVKKFV